MKAKSVKSLKIKRKSQVSTQDDNFWPLFSSDLIANTVWKSPESDKGRGKTASTRSEIRYKEKLISLPSCIAEVTQTLPTHIVAGGTKDIILFSSSSFDLQSFYITNKQLYKKIPIFTNIINAFDILFVNPLWQKSDFSFGFFEWTPTNHIHSNANGTNDVNSYGKYLIRLFHANEWRAITVDDQIPQDFDKNILLPHYYDTENKLHLWPILLTKAILKLNRTKEANYGVIVNEESQSKTKENVCECKKEELRHANICHKNYFVDLDIITTLTGWHATEYKLNSRTKSEKWNTIVGVYEQMTNNEVILISIGCPHKHDVPVMLQLLDVRYYPFVQPEPVNSWKTHRWKNWAIKQGLYKCESQCNGILVCASEYTESKIHEFIDNDKYIGDKATTNTENGAPEGELISKLSVTSKKSTRKSIKQVRNEEIRGSIVNPSKHWLKFDKIDEFLETVKIYHKPDTYANNFKLSSETMNPYPDNYLRYDANAHENLYLCSENTNEEYLHVTLTNMKNSEKARRCCSLIIIPFHWHETSSNSNDSLTRLVAYQSTTDTVVLPKGRHVYLLDVVADHYSALFQSNCDFRLVNEREMWAFLQSDCLSMQNYFDEISGVFYNLIQSVGTDEFKSNLQELYKVILKLFVPTWTKEKYARNYVWKLFMQEMIALLTSRKDKDGVRLIKILFLFPDFITPRNYSYAHHKHVAREMCVVYRELKNQKCPCNEDELRIFEESYVEQVEDYAAITIQSWFKGLTVRKMMKCHLREIKEREIFVAELNKFYEKYFDNTDKSQMYEVIRSMISQRQTRSVKELSVMYNDFKNSVNTVEYKGEVSSFEGDRMSFACSIPLTCHSSMPESYSIRFTLTSSDQILQNDINDLNTIPFIKIIDEANNYPIEYKNNNNNNNSHTCLLMRNHNGYTLYAYFWSKRTHSSLQSSMSWNIEISFQKHVAPLHACESSSHNNNNHITLTTTKDETTQKLPGCDLINANEMTRIDYSGNYKKYYDRKLCRFLFVVNEKETPISIFFKCSLRHIRVNMRVIGQNDDCLYETQTINGELIDIGRKFIKMNEIKDLNELSTTSVLDSNDSSNTQNDSILGRKSMESDTITIQRESLAPTFDFIIEFTFENEANLCHGDVLHWNLNIFYPTACDMNIRYDDSRDIKDEAIRSYWKENQLLERGQALRDVILTKKDVDVTEGVRNDETHKETKETSNHSFEFNMDYLNFDTFHERLETYNKQFL